MKTPAITRVLATAAFMGWSAFAAAETAATPAAPPSTGAAMTSASHPTKSQCESDAKAKKLTGQQKKQFVKDCQAGKTPS